MSLQHLTDKNFEDFVGSSGIPVVVDFWAEWCAPCKKITPMLEKLAEEFYGLVHVVKVDADTELATLTANNVKSIPTIAVFRDGEKVTSITGATSYDRIKSMVEMQL